MFETWRNGVEWKNNNDFDKNIRDKTLTVTAVY